MQENHSTATRLEGLPGPTADIYIPVLSRGLIGVDFSLGDFLAARIDFCQYAADQTNACG